MLRRKKHLVTSSATTVRYSLVTDEHSFIGDRGERIDVHGWSVYSAAGQPVLASDDGPIHADIWFTRIAGMPHHEDSQRPECAPGRPVTLVPEPTNPADKNAIAVYANRRLVGYVPRSAAKRLAPLLSGRRVEAQITTCYSEGGERIGAHMIFSLGTPFALH